MLAVASILLIFAPSAAAAPIQTAYTPIEDMALDSSTNPPFPTPPHAPDTVTTTLPKAPTSALAARMERIAMCESNNVATARNSGSTAKGRFQFLDGTWQRYAQKYWGAAWTKHSVLSYADNTELAYWVARTYGYGDWQESKGCWG